MDELLEHTIMKDGMPYIDANWFTDAVTQVGVIGIDGGHLDTHEAYGYACAIEAMASFADHALQGAAEKVFNGE